MSRSTVEELPPIRRQRMVPPGAYLRHRPEPSGNARDRRECERLARRPGADPRPGPGRGHGETSARLRFRSLECLSVHSLGDPAIGEQERHPSAGHRGDPISMDGQRVGLDALLGGNNLLALADDTNP